MGGGPVVLLTHGTLAHNRMEIMETLQELFSENGVSALASSLGQGLSARSGTYPCATPHTPEHTDALDEIRRIAIAALGSDDSEHCGLHVGPTQGSRFAVSLTYPGGHRRHSPASWIKGVQSQQPPKSETRSSRSTRKAALLNSSPAPRR